MPIETRDPLYPARFRAQRSRSARRCSTRPGTSCSARARDVPGGDGARPSCSRSRSRRRSPPSGGTPSRRSGRTRSPRRCSRSSTWSRSPTPTGRRDVSFVYPLTRGLAPVLDARRCDPRRGRAALGRGIARRARARRRAVVAARRRASARARHAAASRSPRSRSPVARARVDRAYTPRRPRRHPASPARSPTSCSCSPGRACVVPAARRAGAAIRRELGGATPWPPLANLGSFALGPARAAHAAPPRVARACRSSVDRARDGARRPRCSRSRCSLEQSRGSVLARRIAELVVRAALGI